VPVAALSFDLVGTLVLPHPSVGAVYAEVAARHGLERDAGELDAAFPAAFAAVRARWPVPYGKDESDALRFWGLVIEGTFGEPLSYEAVCDLYDAFASAARWRLLPGARDAVALGRERGLPLAVVSNYDARLRRLVDELALGSFAAVVASTDVHRAKPDPAALLEACRLMAVAPESVLHLGDSEREDGELCAATGARWLRVDPAIGIPIAALRAMLDER
jgi:putative hydrolase of the HAD superfamily